jgi:hypothetical protein
VGAFQEPAEIANWIENALLRQTLWASGPLLTFGAKPPSFS